MDSALVRKSYHRPYLRLLGKKLIYRWTDLPIVSAFHPCLAN
jgi:hypothetical protein